MYILDVWFMPMTLSYSLLQWVLVDICYYTGTEIDIIFNAKKSSLFAVGKAHNTPVDSLRIGHDTVSWNDSLKYLGVYLSLIHI